MPSRGEELFNQLQSASFIRGLIGQSEDAHFDCKEWPDNDGDAQKVFAKAACGLTNAGGGVVLVGMKARQTSKDEPDLVDSVALVTDTRAVKSRILDLVGQLVEPRIEGIQAAEVNEPAGSRSGFVVVYIPASEGPPRRSRKDWKFYQRIGSGTFPMEYFQIEERFGKRPPPKLNLYLEPQGIGGCTYAPHVPARWFVLGLENVGAGIARGRVDDVIYPGEVLKITKLSQEGTDKGADGLPFMKSYGPTGQSRTPWIFKAVTFECEISCEGIPTVTIEKVIPELLGTWP